jgi:hypothetical protein
MIETRGRRRAVRAAVVTAAVATLALSGCSRSGGGLPSWGGGLPSGGGQPSTGGNTGGGAMPGMEHGGGSAGGSTGGSTGGGAMPGMEHGGDDHSGGGAVGGGAPAAGGHGHSMPANLNHAPTADQLTKARKFVADTRAAVKASGLGSVAALRAKGYISIGDEMTGTTHYVMPKYHYDANELNPQTIEAFAVQKGQVVAAMYILSNGKTESDIPDIAGNVTMWHNHTLPFRSNNQTDPNFYRLGGAFMRKTAPMLHVWLVPNKCGAFAGTDTANMTGSCEAVIS